MPSSHHSHHAHSASVSLSAGSSLDAPQSHGGGVHRNGRSSSAPRPYHRIDVPLVNHGMGLGMGGRYKREGSEPTSPSLVPLINEHSRQSGGWDYVPPTKSFTLPGAGSNEYPVRPLSFGSSILSFRFASFCFFPFRYRTIADVMTLVYVDGLEPLPAERPGVCPGQRTQVVCSFPASADRDAARVVRGAVWPVPALAYRPSSEYRLLHSHPFLSLQRHSRLDHERQRW